MVNLLDLRIDRSCANIEGEYTVQLCTIHDFRFKDGKNCAEIESVTSIDGHQP
jgi:hypothetical protein